MTSTQTLFLILALAALPGVLMGGGGGAEVRGELKIGRPDLPLRDRFGNACNAFWLVLNAKTVIYGADLTKCSEVGTTNRCFFAANLIAETLKLNGVPAIEHDVFSDKYSARRGER